jgi:hypothetical protein
LATNVGPNGFGAANLRQDQPISLSEIMTALCKILDLF